MKFPSVTSALLLSLFYSVSNAQNLDCSFQDDFDVRNDGSLLMRSVINQVDETVTVELEYNGEGWVGFAFSTAAVMSPNTAVIGLPGVDNVVEKYDLQFRDISGVIPLTERQTLTETSITQEGGTTILSFTKPLVEEGELAVSATGETIFIWALGSGNDLMQHQFRGSGTLQLNECLEAGETAAPVAAPITSAPAASEAGDGIIDLGNGRFQRNLELEGGDLLLELITDEQAGTLTVDLTRAGMGWIAFAVSDDQFMPGSVAVMAFPGDAVGVPQKWDLGGRSLTGVTVAPSNRQTLTEESYFQNETHTNMKFTKLFVEGDEPVVSLTEDNFFLYATGPDNSFSPHSLRNNFNLNFAEGGAVDIPAAGGVPNKGWWMTHGLMMAISWAILVPLAISSSILRSILPFPDGMWFQIHRGLNSLGVALTIAGFSIAVYLINDEQGDSAEHFTSLRHHKVGLTIFIFAFLQALSGIVRPHLPAPHKPDEVIVDDVEVEDAAADDHMDKDDLPTEKTLIRKIWEYQHRILGTVAMTLSWYNCDSGIEAYNARFGGPDQSGALWGVIAGITLTTLFVALYARFRKP